MISRHFSEEEIRELCMTVSIDFESLGGDGKPAKANRLVMYMDRRGRAGELLAILDELRDNVAWPAM